MSVRRTLSLAAVAVMAAGAFLPAHAATPKFAGSYKVTLQPDPTINVFSTADMKNCFSLRPEAVDKHKLVVPTAGKLKVVLDSPDPTGRNVTDWDMYIVDSSDGLLGKGSGATSHEEVTITFKKKTPITVIVCNLAGTNEGTVTYSLK